MRTKRRKIKKPRLKKESKKPQKVLFKIKPLELNKKVKRKKPPKPTKPLVKAITLPPPSRLRRAPKPIKLVKPKKLEPSIFKTKIKVIGIGGGGSSIISEMAPKIKRVNFLAANTDLQALKAMGKRARHFQFGRKLTQGLGTGMNPELGEQAAESDKEKIKELLKETDFCILISCLGGGTGSGASPVFGKILKNLKILTLGIFTLPFEFEGGKKAQIAKDSLEKLRQNLNALVIIPNQKIFQIVDKNTPLKETLSTINKALIESLEGLITLIYSPGLIHVDFATLKTNLAGRGRLAYFNTVEIESPNQAEELVKKVVSNPLIPYAVQGAKEVLFNIDGGLNLNMSQVEQIGKTISDSISPQARVAFGVTQNKKGGIKITLLANGCKWEKWEKEKEKPKKKPKEKQALITRVATKAKRTSFSSSPSLRSVGEEEDLSSSPTKIQDYNPLASSRSRSKQAPKPKKKVRKKTKEKLPEFPKVQQPEIIQIPTEESEKVEIKVRKNALEVQKALQEEEKRKY